ARSSARSRPPRPPSPACPRREGSRERVAGPPGGRAVIGDGLRRLQALLQEHGGLMATLLSPAGAREARDPRPAAASPATLAAEGPRAAGRRDDYELLVEAIYEGYLLHYGSPRVVSVPEADLRLL